MWDKHGLGSLEYKWKHNEQYISHRCFLRNYFDWWLMQRAEVLVPASQFSLVSHSQWFQHVTRIYLVLIKCTPSTISLKHNHMLVLLSWTVGYRAPIDLVD